MSTAQQLNLFGGLAQKKLECAIEENTTRDKTVIGTIVVDFRHITELVTLGKGYTCYLLDWVVSSATPRNDESLQEL